MNFYSLLKKKEAEDRHLGHLDKVSTVCRTRIKYITCHVYRGYMKPYRFHNYAQRPGGWGRSRNPAVL